MSEKGEQQLTAHKPGRRAFEIAPRKWPVVTKESFKHAQDLEKYATKDENPLVTPLLKGLILCYNVELHLKAAFREAQKRRDVHNPLIDDQRPLWHEANELVRVLNAQVIRLQQLKEEWPLEVVG